MFAAIASERNSIGVEVDESLQRVVQSQISTEKVLALNRFTNQRLEQHEQFVRDFNKPLKHFNANHNFEVVTRQESQLRLRFIESLQTNDTEITANYCNEEPIIPKVS